MAPTQHAPVEWVRGTSRSAWFAGFCAVFSAAFIAAEVALFAGLSWSGAQVPSPNLTLVVNLGAVAISIGPLLLYVDIVPVPASRLGVSPEGVVVDFGLRSERFPWSRTLLRGNRLESFSPRAGFRNSYSLTPYQASRLADLRPTG